MILNKLSIFNYTNEIIKTIMFLKNDKLWVVKETVTNKSFRYMYKILLTMKVNTFSTQLTPIILLAQNFPIPFKTATNRLSFFIMNLTSLLLFMHLSSIVQLHIFLLFFLATICSITMPYIYKYNDVYRVHLCTFS